MSDPVTARPTDPEALQIYDPLDREKVGRHVALAISWKTKAIARDLAPHLKAVTYTDVLSGAADDLALELEDREALWSGDWKPTFGDKVVARAATSEGWAWFGSKVNSIALGTFAHDKISLSGPPRVAALQCISAAMATGLRRRKRTKAWRGVSLKFIAQDIAKRAEMKLNWDGAEGAKYEHVFQHNKSDLEFLEEQLKEIGRTIKVHGDSIIIFDEHKLDAGKAVGDIDLRGGRVKGWAFDSGDSDRFGSCHVTCFNPRSGKKVEAEFPPKGTKIPGLDDNGQTLELAIEISDASEAAARAASLLRNANRFATSGKLTTVGDLGLQAGVVFNLTNAGALSGKFIITRAEHHLVGGYICTIDVRRCLEGY